MKRALVLAAFAACDDGLDQRLAIVDEPRVLAVIAEPAEAKPGEAVTYAVVAGAPDGTLAIAPRWSYCLAPKPPTEDNAVSDGCLRDDQLLDLGSAPMVTAALPADACATFGPDTPPGGFRPRDADPTGGFYQPVRADVDAIGLAFGLSRITCELGNAPLDVAREYDMRYVANANPTIAAVTIDGVADAITVPANTDVELAASWPAEAAEPFVYFDRLIQRLVDRREAMRLSWFATAGALAVDASAIAEAELGNQVSTTWHTPGPGTATLWFVLRDSRNGVAVRELTVTVE